MDPFVHTVSRGFTYSYIRIPPSSSPPKPNILFLHGFPSIALEWHNQIEYLRGKGFGVIAPDLLGYGKTSRPIDPVHYRFKDICQDVIEILDYEKVDVVLGVAHDMGVGILSRLDFYFPQRISKLALLATGYHPPGAVVDLEAANASFEKSLGYSLYGYMKFFIEDSEAVEILNNHHSSFSSLMYANDPALWRNYLAPIGALKKWLQNDKQAEIGPWISPAYRAARDEAFTKDGGYTAPLNWYRCLVNNMNLQDEPEDECKTFRSAHPVLLVLAEKDAIVLPSLQLEATKPWVKDLTVKQVPTGHWPMAEASEKVNQELGNFFGDID
ncbi:alpha/beta-hydrolase [Corynespora cassiicola Philippines]|uniref:Alpha/beta-hydrolase n=1 Tax=Corynespora cassiicola Philippines TaxID=1448308 RepID=A0A2T2NBD8_CORCC|nr:alpha/beta-hydrolase [Corynespora cassiicola Philippines]